MTKIIAAILLAVFNFALLFIGWLPRLIIDWSFERQKRCCHRCAGLHREVWLRAIYKGGEHKCGQCGAVVKAAAVAAIILLVSLTAMGQASYNFYLDGGEAGASGNQVTTTILNNSTFTNLVTGTWSIFPSPHTKFAVTNQFNATLRGSHLIGNSYFDGSGKQMTFQVECGLNNGQDNKCQFNFGGTVQCGQVAVGYFFRRGPVTAGFGDSVDTFSFVLNSGDFLVVNHYSDSVPGLRLHANFSDVSTIIPITSNKTYWVTALVDTNNGANGTSKFAVFDPVTWLMVDTPRSLANSAKSMVQYMKFGDLFGHTINEKYSMWFDNFLIKTGAIAAAQWPLLPAGATVTAASSSRADFDQAYTNAVSGAGTNKDIVAIPTGNSTWASGYTVAKTNLVIKGNGTNNTTIVADNGSTLFTLFTVSGSLNTFSNMAIRGDLVNDEVDAFYNTGWYNKYSSLWVREMNVAFYCERPCLIDNSVIADCWRAGRIIFGVGGDGGSGFYDTFYPLAYTSTNYAVFEDNRFYWTSAKNDLGASAIITSQEGQAFIIRHNYFYVGVGAPEPAPWIDSHGDWDPGSFAGYRPGLIQVYSNYMDYARSTTIFQKAIDDRGGEMLAYSNRWVGVTFQSNDGIVMREEHPEDSSPYIVTNTYVWENYHGSAGTTAMPVNGDATVTLNVEYFTTSPAGFSQLAYPHPLRNISSVPFSTASAAKLGKGRQRSIFISRP